MKSNNSDLVKLPADFMSFICDCQKLIQDVKHSQRYREELEDFEFSLSHPQFRKKDILQLPLLFEIIKKWDLIAKYIWNPPKKHKKFKVSHYWHNLACKKTLLEIKQQLEHYPTSTPVSAEISENNLKKYEINKFYKIDVNNTIAKHWKSYSKKSDVKASNPNFLVVGKRIGNNVKSN